MEFLFFKLVLILLFLVMGLMGRSSSKGCEFPATYNFGDSNSDTGAISAAKSLVNSPNGETFFGHPAGRFCDGRLLIDFIAETLKLPYLSAYLDSIGTNFRHGANFATGGSSIRPGGYSPFHLAIQIAQFIQFKSRTIALFNKLSSNRTTAPFKSTLPRPKDFSKALYTVDIGQNDLYYGFNHTNLEEVRSFIPDVLEQFSQAVKQLYQEGARFFWIHNTGPIGCLPYSIIYDKSNNVTLNLDHTGCIKPKNEVTQEFNTQLKNKISLLRVQLPKAAITFVDVYSVKYALLSKAKNQGFVDPINFCCGSYYGYQVDCGKKAIVNGTVYGNPCDHPSMHIFWDGFHYSEAANLWVSNHILNGSFSDPPISIEQVCLHSGKI